VRNTLAFNNDTIRTFTTLGNLASGKGNLSSVSSILIAGGLVQGEPILNTSGAPVINSTVIANYAGANRTIDVLDEASTHRIFQWDQLTGVLVSFRLDQPSAQLYYKLTGTNLWRYNIAIYDGNCEPIMPISCGYTPLETTIIAGTTLAYRNTGTATHSVNSCTPDNHPPPSPEACSFINYPSTAPSFASGSIMPGKVWNLTLPVPGEFYYYDNYNPNMKGVVTVLGNATTPPDFAMHASPDPLVIPQGLSMALTVSASATGGYTGPVEYGGAFPTGPDYPTANGPGGTAYLYGGSGGSAVTFGVSTSFNTPQGTYHAIITGTGNNLTRSTTLTIIVTSPAPSFYLSPGGNMSIDMVTGHTTSLTITVHSVVGYAGLVSLVAYSYSPGSLTASITPGSVTLWPDGMASATLTLRGDYEGNFTVTIWANNQNLTLTNKIFFNVQVHKQVGLLLYELYYFGSLYPGSSVLLVNRFTNLGNIPDQVLYGTITFDFGTFPFTIFPIILLQPGQTATYNLTITIPANTQPGNHPVTATLTWEALLSEFWTTAPPLIINGQLPIQASTQVTPPPTQHQQGPSSLAWNALTSTTEIVKNYWLWIAAIYIPSITILTSLFIIHEQRRRGGSRRSLQIPG